MGREVISSEVEGRAEVRSNAVKKYRVLTLALALAACAVALPGAGRRASAHKFHTSFTEASYNAETRSLEVSLRTFPDDVDAAVRRRAGAQTTPPAGRDRKKAFEEAVAAYVAETFRLQTAKGEAVKLEWVGMDAGVDSAWLYFEARLPEGPEGLRLRNLFLFDLFDDQVNLVTVRAGERKASLRFERGGEFQRIETK